MELRVAGEKNALRATPVHPFRARRNASDVAHWIDAADLVAGDQLETQNGDWATVESVKPLDGLAVVYNFTVEQDHDYFVGDEGLLVHNAGSQFGSGLPPHIANVSVYDSQGQPVYQDTFTSGNMTPEEAALGFPQSTLATHTEARAVNQIPLNPGDSMVIQGQYPPCPYCKGQMNGAAGRTGADIEYRWDQDGEPRVWKATPRGCF